MDAPKQIRVVVASDHAGYELKETVKAELQRQGREVEDCGVFSCAAANWAEYGALAASKVASDPEHVVGILICGSGIGMSIVANKFPGVRAALCHTEDAACLARRHNDANALALGARVVDAAAAMRIVAVFFATPFEGGRHQARLDYLRDHIEKRVCK